MMQLPPIMDRIAVAAKRNEEMLREAARSGELEKYYGDGDDVRWTDPELQAIFNFLVEHDLIEFAEDERPDEQAWRISTITKIIDWLEKEHGDGG